MLLSFQAGDWERPGKPGVKANVIFFDSCEASPDRWTRETWYYDYRTNVHRTLKQKPMRFEHLAEFIECYNPSNGHKREGTQDEEENPDGQWRNYSYAEFITRDRTSLDLLWLRNKSLTALENLAGPDELTEAIIENLEAGLDSFREVLAGWSHVRNSHE